MNAAPLDGQVIGKDVTLQGGEAHSFLFSGEIIVRRRQRHLRRLQGAVRYRRRRPPPGTTFTVNYIATRAGRRRHIDGHTRGAGRWDAGRGRRAVPARHASSSSRRSTPRASPGGSGATRRSARTRSTIGAGTAQGRPHEHRRPRRTGRSASAKTIEDLLGRRPRSARRRSFVPVAVDRALRRRADRRRHARSAFRRDGRRGRRGVPGRHPHRADGGPGRDRPARRLRVGEPELDPGRTFVDRRTRRRSPSQLTNARGARRRGPAPSRS